MTHDSTPARKAVPKRVRYEVLRRDGFRCRYCGGEAPDVKLTVDHVMPVVLGGADDPTNLVTACRDCNAGKSSSAPDAQLVADVSEVGRRFTIAMLTDAADAERAERGYGLEIVEWFDAAWNAYYWPSGDAKVRAPRLPTWRAAVMGFDEAGITKDDFTYAIDVAFSVNTVKSADKWRYFCGVIRKILARRAELAVEIVGGQ